MVGDLHDPLTVGFLIAGPIAGYLSDRFGDRPFAIGGMLLGAASFGLLMALPADFAYLPFAVLIFLNGFGSGLFIAPNSTQIMNAVPPFERRQASGMWATTTNAGQVLSIGIFFTLIIAGLADALPHAITAGLAAQNVPAEVARQVASAPPVASLFAAFLGYNPMGELIRSSSPRPCSSGCATPSPSRWRSICCRAGLRDRWHRVAQVNERIGPGVGVRQPTAG